jgi:DNA-binding transcriptional LysR family regulator
LSDTFARIEIRHLRYFLAVADSRSLRRAAEHLNISQPPLGRQITQLEEEIGVRLFARSTSGVVLTEAGQELLVHARDIIERMATAAAATRMAGLGMAGLLSIGYVDDFLSGILPTTLNVFKSRFDRVVLHVELLPAEPVLRGVLDGKLDIGFVPLPLPANASGLALAAFRPLPLVTVLPAGHRYAGREELSLAELNDETWIWATTRPDSGFYQQIAALFHRARISPRILSGFWPSDMMVNFVAGGHGIGLLTRESISPNRSDVTFVPLIDQGAEINLAMVWRDDRMRNTLRSFLLLSREVMAGSLITPIPDFAT